MIRLPDAQLSKTSYYQTRLDLVIRCLWESDYADNLGMT